MDQPELFRVTKATIEGGAYGKRCERRDAIKTWKEKYRIYTHNAPDAGRWIAFSMDECCEAFKGYGLSEEEKTDGFHMLAGYCRLMDDMHLVEDNHRTEFEACEALVKRLEAK